MEISELYESFFDITKIVLPYKNNEEHLSELFSLLDLCFTVLVSAKGYEGNGFPTALKAGNMQDLSVSSVDLSGILFSRHENKESVKISEEAREQIVLAVYHIQDRLKKSAEKDFMPAFEVVRLKFDLEDFETFSLLLALSVEYDRKYEGVYSYLHNNISDYYASKWMAIKLYKALSGISVSGAEILSGSSALTRFLCSRELKKRDRSECSERLVLSGRVTAYILGNNNLNNKLRGICTLADEYKNTELLPVREELFDKTATIFFKNAFKEKGCFVLNLYGPKGIGKGYMAYKAVSAAGMKLLKIDLPTILRNHFSELDKYLDMIYCETVLSGAVPCFVSDSQVIETDENGVQHRTAMADKLCEAAGRISSLFRFLFWLTPEKDGSFTNTEAKLSAMEVPMLTANERSIFWKKYLPQKELDIMSYSNKYILTPRDIRRSAVTAEEIADIQGKPLSDSIVTSAVRQHCVNPLGSLASPINAVFTWDDLIVSEEQKRQMKMICNQVRYRSVVNEDWGFRKKSPYGRGLCALFYGSPGTGKTMAVQVMANELGLELYRIDLSQLTSKYIGETQKNIAALFDKAKNINAMLFFDEADSMFAKRSEVKDSNDRYANADTAYLLQRLEDHEGITILATNYVNNIDDAFKRRIKFMINFVFPTADVRLRLWKGILPDTVRIDEPIDFEFFADRFELSGSNIKEILTNSAYIAASENEGLKNKHIIEAIKLNYSKYGKILTNADFDYLGR